MDSQELLVTISKVAKFLGEPLPYTNIADLRAHLVGLEATRLEVAKKRCEWLKKLHESELKVLHPKDKDITELDRRIGVQSAVAEVRRDYEYLVSLEELTKYRLEFGSQLLRDVYSG